MPDNKNIYTYDALYEASMNNYNKLLKQLEAITKTEIYEKAIYDMPFSLLRTLYLAQRIEIFTEAPENKKPEFKYTSIQDALVTYRDMVQYKKNLNALLDAASLILEADKIVDKINTYVKLSDYLNDSLLIKKHDNLTKIAKECIDTLPKCQDSITTELRYALLKDMLNQFKEDQILILLDKKIITPKDYNHFAKLNYSENFKNNLTFICKHFGLSEKLLFAQEFRLKGVSYLNEDGTNRQDILKNLKEVSEKDSTVSLQLRPFIYRPPLGSPEPAVAVLWEGKELGYLPKEISAQLHNEYKDNTSDVEFVKVLGGEKNDTTGKTMNYGLCIKLSIYEIEQEKEHNEQIKEQ